jgi:hypothetical protein
LGFFSSLRVAHMFVCVLGGVNSSHK